MFTGFKINLFECSSDNIGLHLKNIFQEKELDKILTTEKISVVRQEGTRKVKRELEFYNLDAIIAVGYRVNSKKTTKFRIWATKILKDYMIKGFAIDTEKMKNGPKFGKDYYAEDMAEEHQIMTMNDWIKEIDELLKFRKKNVLNDSGKISHKQAIEKSENEYEKFRVKQDREYISSMDEMYKRYLEENNK